MYREPGSRTRSPRGTSVERRLRTLGSDPEAGWLLQNQNQGNHGVPGLGLFAHKLRPVLLEGEPSGP